jgi:hypothetical protein
VRPDVAPTLGGWQKAGLSVFLLRADAQAAAAPMAIRPPGLFGRFALWLRRTALPPDETGAFGVRISSQGQGG